MKFYISVLLVSLLSAHCVIQNSEKTLKKLMEMITYEGIKLADLEYNKKLLEHLKNRHSHLVGENHDELVKKEQYIILTETIKEFEADLYNVDNQISKLFDEAIEINNKNKIEIDGIKKNLIEAKQKLNLKGSTKTKQKVQRNLKLTRDLALIEEKERYLSIETEMMEVFRTQILVKQHILKGILENTNTVNDSFTRACMTMREKLEAINTERMEQPILINADAFWNDLSIRELKKLNRANEKMLTEVKPVIEEIGTFLN